MSKKKKRHQPASAPTEHGTHARSVEEQSVLGSFLASWREQPWSIRVLRVFLGITFLYAGYQKFADPYYLKSDGATFIGFQLQAFSQGSPIGGLLSFLDRAPVLTGIGVALGEIAIGAGTLLGVLPIVAAFGGFAISAVLALSASLHVYPYFIASDSAYAIAWLALALWLREDREVVEQMNLDKGLPAQPFKDQLMTRRDLVRGGAATALSAFAAFAALSVGNRRSAQIALDAANSPSPSAPSPSASAGSAGGGSSGGGSSGGANVIASLSDIPVGGAIPFDGPQGVPGALFRLEDRVVCAYSRICTHEGCKCGYDQNNNQLVCPCHGARFDPAQNGAVVTGPTRTPLPAIPVTIDANDDIVLA